MNRLHFFGDSWTIEDDFEKLIENPIGYPSMVGKLLNRPVINHAISGSSQLKMVDIAIKSNLGQEDHAVFSMSAPSRRFYFDYKGHIVDCPVDENKGAVNDYQDSWLSAITCFMLIKICEERKCTPWFVNIFNVSYQSEWLHPLWHAIPPNVWLLPPDRCMVQDVLDAEWFSQFSIFRNSDFNDWLSTNNEQVIKYIRPCYNHPNLLGRKKIAEFIADKLVPHL